MALVPTTKADLADKHWLNDKVGELRSGIEAARDIWANWTSGRNVSRFADTTDYGAYIAEQLGHPLVLTDAIAAMPGASTRAIAKVAGTNPMAVSRAKAGVTPVTPAPTPTTLATVQGTDGKTYPATQKEKPAPINVPAIAGVPKSVAPAPSPLVTDAIRLLKQVAELDISAIRMATTAHQYRRLNKAAARAEKVSHELSLPMLTL